MAKAKKLSDKKIYQYWVEIRELATGSVRKLPLTAWRVVCLKRGKKNGPPLPDKELLRLEDDGQIVEADTFDEFKTRLRGKYPDAAFERTLHYVRDQEAEERYEQGLNSLIRILAKAAVEDLLAEASRTDAEPEARRT